VRNAANFLNGRSCEKLSLLAPHSEANVLSMKTTQFISVIAVCMALSLHCKAADLFKGKLQTFSAGALRHVDHVSLPKLPYDDGDISFALAWEGHDDDGYWQIAVDYMPNPGGKVEPADYVITPHINLLFRDRLFCAGVGLLDSYVSYSESGGDWTDIYWQLIAGLRFDLGKSAALAIDAYLPFKNWSNIEDEWNADGVEYGIWLAMSF